MSKNIVDFISEEDYPRYNELLNKAQENKNNAPKKARAPKAPLTAEQKVAKKRAAYEKAQKELEAALAEQGSESEE